MSPNYRSPQVGSRQLSRNVVFQSASFEEGLARIEYVVGSRRPAALVIGSPGTGKSTLITRSIQRLRLQGFETQYVDALGSDGGGLLLELGDRLCIPNCSGANHVELWRAIQDRLEEFACQGQQLAIFVDHVDQAASRDLATALLRLIKAQDGSIGRLTVILTAEDAQRIPPALRDLCELRIELDLWTLSDTIRYLEQQYGDGEGDEACPFLGDAAVRLHELSQGTPRRLAQLARLSYLASFDQADTSIDAVTVSDVHEALSVTGKMPAPVAVGSL